MKLYSNDTDEDDEDTERFKALQSDYDDLMSKYSNRCGSYQQLEGFVWLVIIILCGVGTFHMVGLKGDVPHHYQTLSAIVVSIFFMCLYFLLAERPLTKEIKKNRLEFRLEIRRILAKNPEDAG